MTDGIHGKRPTKVLKRRRFAEHNLVANLPLATQLSERREGRERIAETSERLMGQSISV